MTFIYVEGTGVLYDTGVKIANNDTAWRWQHISRIDRLLFSSLQCSPWSQDRLQ